MGVFRPKPEVIEKTPFADSKLSRRPRSENTGAHGFAPGPTSDPGNQVMQKNSQAISLSAQPKIESNHAISSPGDSYEQEADHMADRVMNTHEPKAQERKRARPIKAGDEERGTIPSNVQSALRSPGQPLDPETRAFMEPRFGHDFSEVRVHTGPSAENSARDMDAQAYTAGHDVVFGPSNFNPSTESGRRLIAHELAHVVQEKTSQLPDGAAPMMIYRQVQSGSGGGSGGGGGPRRIVYLDNDVVGAVVDGNKPVADALMKMRADGADVRITRYNYVETTRGEPVRAATRMFVIEKLAITIDEGGGLASRAQTYEELSSGKPAAIQPKDVPMLAAVRAAGPGAELWTLDGGPKENAKRFGVKLAPESSLTQQPPGQMRLGLDNVGLNAYEITADGTPVRRGQLLPGKAAPATYAASAPTGGSSPSSPPSSSPGSAKSSEPVTTAETGAPLKPVAESTPGFKPEAGAGIGGAFQVLQARQVGNLAQDEILKYEKRYAQLQPKIDAWFAKGYSVELTCIVEKPKSPDVFCGAGIYCESNQIIFFHDLYISRVISNTVVTTTYTSNHRIDVMSAPGGRDSFIPYVYQGGSLHDEWEISYMQARDSEHRCVAGKLILQPPLSAMIPVEPVRPSPPQTAKPKLDEATKKALALFPSQVYLLPTNIVQYKKANEIEKRLVNNASFTVIKTEMWGGSRSHTFVSYFSILDKPRAEALAEILRASGLPEAFAEVSGDGDDTPGHLQVTFGRDAE